MDKALAAFVLIAQVSAAERAAVYARLRGAVQQVALRAWCAA
jgi:hypothetical protein